MTELSYQKKLEIAWNFGIKDGSEIVYNYTSSEMWRLKGAVLNFLLDHSSLAIWLKAQSLQNESQPFNFAYQIMYH